MAEAFPENISDKEEGQENPISVLLLSTKWQFDTYGLSTVNKSLVNNLRVVDPEGEKIKITCAVVEEDEKIESFQKEDAEKYKVQLRGSKQPRGPKKKKPSTKWLERNTATYYLDLVRKNHFDFIIGHVPHLANGALNLRDICSTTKNKPKVFLMMHDFPKNKDGDTDEDMLLEWLSEADIVFSMGKEVKAEVFSSIASLPPEQRPIHKLYIPGYPLEFFNVHRVAVEGNKLQGTQNITLMTGDRKYLDISGIDFPLAVTSAFGASKHILEFDGVKTNFVFLISSREDKNEWKNEFVEIIQKENLKGRSFIFQPDAPETLEKLKTHMRKSNLFILPLKSVSLLFGTEALTAVAAAVPILVSSHSGIASILETIAQDESIVRELSLETDKAIWKERILQKLLRPEESQKAAARLREQLLLDTSIAETHLEFTRTISEASCVRLEVELDSDSVVTQEHIDSAIRFGVDSGDTPIDTKKYVLAFIQKLLLQREKLDLELLTDYIQSHTVSLWKDVLSTLENSNRKLLGVQSGSLIFTLFCPTFSSVRELQDDSWIKTLSYKMEQLLNNIGIKTQLQIHTSEDVMETELLPRLREMKLRHTVQSEGYETMTQYSSDIASEIFDGLLKVTEWLKQHPDPSAEPERADSYAFNLLETIKLNHVVLGGKYYSLYVKFSISQLSGCIGIVSQAPKPTVSIMYPGTDKVPLVFSRVDRFTSALFIAKAEQGYLAAASRDKIYLLNLVENTPSVVYNFKDSGNWHLCVIDDRTVTWVAEKPPSGGFSEVYILNTDSEKFSLSSWLQVQAGDEIGDICYAKTTDGTPCLLLSFPWDYHVKCVEMVGGRVRWQVDTQQMGGLFVPWSICRDGSTVFVVSFNQDVLHLLSVEDGSFLTSIGLYPLGIHLSSCVRFQGKYMYIGHVNENADTHFISKLTKPVTI